MTALSNCARKSNHTVATGAWFAGVGLFVLEMSASLNYLQAGLEKHVPSMVSLLPLTAMMTVRLVGHVVENLASIEYGMRMLPLVGVPLAFMVAGLVFERRAARSSR